MCEHKVSDTERRLVDIWSDVLGIGDVPRHTPFLSYGDSLGAIECHAAIAEQCGVELPLVVFFSRQSALKDIAEMVDRANAET